MSCPICLSPTRHVGSATILQRHRASFHQCEKCGFVHAGNPAWLQEAYATAITSTDIGYVQRSLDTTAITLALLTGVLHIDGPCLDYGGGYGLLTRMMRDRGFDFHSYDPYCEPIFAAGSVCGDLSGRRYELVTCFEVFEHLTDPVAELERLLEITDTVLLSTVLISDPAPQPEEWWYYGLSHGQHISFFTRPALNELAARFQLKCLSNGNNFHLLTRRKVSRSRFALLSRLKAARMLTPFVRRTSLLDADYQRLLQAQPAAH